MKFLFAAFPHQVLLCSIQVCLCVCALIPGRLLSILPVDVLLVVFILEALHYLYSVICWVLLCSFSVSFASSICRCFVSWCGPLGFLLETQGRPLDLRVGACGAEPSGVVLSV